jgi:hypothetical protein
MAVADLLYGVGGEHPDGVHRTGVDVGPVVRNVRCGEGGDIGGGC